MRLRWESLDPAALAEVLRAVLGADGHPQFVNATLEIVGTTDDDARKRADRLVLLGPSDPGGPTSIVLGIATVDTDRYAAERGWTLTPLPHDPILGAFASAVDGQPWALLEPNTEGRLAAFLARNGEGPAALYVAVPARSPLNEVRTSLAGDGITTTAIVAGPFGAQFTVLGRSAWAPTLLICAFPPATPGTIPG